jgi:hypothetical protein
MAEGMRAKKVWNGAGTKATIVLLDQDGNEVGKAGGNRASRGVAVLVLDGQIYGIRGDLMAAETEAARMRRGSDGFKVVTQIDADGSTKTETASKHRGDRPATVKARHQRHYDYYKMGQTVLSVEPVSGLHPLDVTVVKIEEEV